MSQVKPIMSIMFYYLRTTNWNHKGTCNIHVLKKEPQRGSHTHGCKNNSVTKMLWLYQGSRQKCALNWYDELLGLAELWPSPALFDQFKGLWWKCNAVNKVSLLHSLWGSAEKKLGRISGRRLFSAGKHGTSPNFEHRLCVCVCVWEREREREREVDISEGIMDHIPWNSGMWDVFSLGGQTYLYL